MIDIQINDKTYQIPEGISIIEAADQHGIYIPRFCYHKKLSIAANCRMCLVEVGNMKKPMPACSTPVAPDMVVFTQSEKALEAQRNVMEFLLINHPLDCPVCDQGGACELQDLSVGFGCSESDFGGSKRAVEQLELGPLVQTYMTRCIQCTRCIRFSRELAGLSELGMINRGGGEKVSTYVDRDLQSELSGNMIDVCPVGALTAKPSRFVGRSWEYREHAGVAAHDALGSNIYWHSSQHDNVETRDVMRVVPKENESINECWLSDRDRFSFEGLTHESRLLSPMVKHNGAWKTVAWEAALSECADKLKALIDCNTGDCLGVLVGPQATMEAGFLLQKMTRALGSKHIDSRIREQDFTDQSHRLPSPRLGCAIADIDSLDTLFLLGCDVRTQHPVLTARLNPAIEAGLSVCAMSAMDYEYTFPVTDQLVAAPGVLLKQLAAMVVFAAKETGKNTALTSAEPLSPEGESMVKRLMQSEKAAIIMGEQALAGSQAAVTRALLNELAELLGVSFGELPCGANTAGLQYVGCVPHRQADGMGLAEPGLNAVSMMTSPRRAYLLYHLEPEHDVLEAAKTIKTLDEAALVICFTPFVSDAMTTYADVLLPIAPPSEVSGQYMNIEGVIQSFQAVSVPHGEARPGWKVLRVFANFLGVADFEYSSIESVREELSVTCESEETQSQSPKVTELPDVDAGLTRLAPWPMVRSDSLVRRAASLQQTLRPEQQSVVLNQAMAEAQGLSQGDRVTVTQGDSQVVLSLSVADRVADECVIIPSGLDAVAGFGSAEQAVTLEKCSD